MVAEDLRLQLYALAPAPSRDYYGLTITGSEVILNVWNISHGPHIYPRRQRALLEDFEDENVIQNEIRIIFGHHVLNFCKSIAANDRHLQTLPTKIFLKIVRLLASRDILALSQTSKIFFELCNSDAVWKLIFRKKIRRPIAREDSRVADDIGWRGLLKKKLDIRNKILKTATGTGSKPKNNSNMITSKQKNIDIIRNLKQDDAARCLNNLISITELSVKNNKANVVQRDIFKNAINQAKIPCSEPRSIRSANARTVNINLNITDQKRHQPSQNSI
ncbi:F-box domain-containing protein [Oryctes borbonicus]|uniref:F-box domain-containing protein n=1 Tax=Oryctes borbonicus TaxID=1629725 RepID=A0A0T6BE93_9SCAR|nr:F-box domain-containing protein [Oryctes borbonicus]